jgi:hypothetical protein
LAFPVRTDRIFGRHKEPYAKRDFPGFARLIFALPQTWERQNGLETKEKTELR